jgi:AraC-like DNA-binding protein
MNDLAVALYAAGGGGAVLAALQTASLSPATKAYQAASGFLAAVAVNAGLNAYGLLTPTPAPELLLLSATLLGMFAPLLWLYVDDLSSDVARVWRWGDFAHFAPAILMGLLTTSVALLPGPQRASLLGAAPPTGLIDAISVAVIGLTLLILVQGGYLIWRILIRLLRLRGRLRQVMSNADRHQLLWLRLVTALFLLNGVITIADNLDIVSIPEVAFAAFGLAFTLAMGVWAVRQAPAFQVDAGALERLVIPADEAAEPASPKYERSRLDDERLEKIAARIDAAFRTDRLHLDANLSLKKLAAVTGVTEINLSQTFSRKLNQTFFDYVNAWRVEEAKALLLASNATIVAVALEAGFNSRSAFYSAFKEITGQTPSAFRAAPSSTPRASAAGA